MRERPEAHELLAIARATLKNDILAALPADKKYAALMIANAMSIAERQYAVGNKNYQTEFDALCQVLGVSPLSYLEKLDKLEDPLNCANREVAVLIRNGYFDNPETQQKLKQLLWSSVTARVRESNPKALGIDQSACAQRQP